MIRGFSANRLLYSVDGVRMNTAIFRSGNLQNVISLDPFSLQTTEVQVGPGSVMYGSDAIGGVMVFETLSPTSSGKAANILTRFSSAMNEKTIHADISYGGEKLRFLTSISRFDFGDLKKIVASEIINKFDHATVFNKNTPHIELAKELEKRDHNVILVDYQPTSEMMLVDFAKKIINRLPENVKLHSLKLQETGTSNAEWYASDQIPI